MSQRAHSVPTSPATHSDHQVLWNRASFAWPTSASIAASGVLIAMLVIHAFVEGEWAHWFINVGGSTLACGLMLTSAYHGHRVRALLHHAEQSRRRLEESESRFRVMADHAPALIWTSGRDAKRDYLNQRWLDFTGRTLEQELGDGCLEGVHPNDREHCVQKYMDAFKSRVPFSMEYRLRHADGTYRWVLDCGQPRFEAGGVFVGFVGCCVDVTSLRDARDRMREERDRYEALADLAPVGIFETNVRGDATYLNQRWLDIAGLTREQALGPGWAEALHPDDRERVYAAWYSAATQGHEFRENYRFRRPDGQTFWLNGAAHPLRDQHGAISGFLGTITDVTALIEAEQQVRNSLHAQEQLTERERLLLSELDHRVRNNLAGLLGLIRLNEHRAANVPELAAAIRSSVRSMALAHDLIGRGNASTDIGALARLMFERLPPDDRARIDIGGPTARLSPRRVGPLAIALQEIVTNAVKHGALSRDFPQGRVSLRWEQSPADSGWTIRWVEHAPTEPAGVPATGEGMGIIESICTSELGGSARWERFHGGSRWIITIASDDNTRASTHATSDLTSVLEPIP